MTRWLRPRVLRPATRWRRIPPAAAAWAVLGVALSTAGIAAPVVDAGYADRVGIEATLLPDDPNTLDLPAVDVAIIAADPPATPAARLLRLRVPERGMPILELLVPERSGWAVGDRSTVDFDGLDGATVPWLVRLGDAERFAVLAADASGIETRVRRVDIVGTRIVEGPSTALAGAISGGGSADVDGDGSAELVLAGPSQPGRTPATAGGCATVLHVLDGTTLAQRSRLEIGPIHLGSMALAELDGLPGRDLAATIAASCPGGQRVQHGFSTTVGDLVGIRLLDGRLLGQTDLAGPTDRPAGPLPVAIGGSAPDLLVTMDGERSVLVDPAAGWHVVPMAMGPTRPLGVVSTAAGSGGGGAIALADVTGDQATGLELVAVARGAAGPVVTSRELPSVAGLGDRLANWTAGRDRPRWPASWSGDVDGDGCPDLVVPLLVLPCATGTDVVARHGPAWIATRPLAVMPGAPSRLLVASSLAWDPAGDGLLDPSPLPVGDATGGWRSGPSSPFALAELPSEDLLYFADFPTPIPTVDETTGRDPLEAVVAGRAGDRVLARWHAVGADEVGTPVDGTATGVGLRDRPTAGERIVIARAAVRAGGLSGVEIRSIHIPLAPDGAADERAWRIDVVGLNDWGEASSPVASIVSLDVLGPRLVVDVPFVSAPWPFRAPITGRAEPGSIVGLVGGDETEVANRIGQFTLRTPLAPWPQDVEVRATDAEGNETIQRFSVMGGLDVRRLPWQALVALGVLGAVAWTALRGAGARAPIAARRPERAVVGGWTLRDDTDPLDEPAATIEELDPASGPTTRRPGR